MTKAVGCQKEVFDMQEVLEYFRVSELWGLQDQRLSIIY